jgi:hypothetical protein
MIDKILQNACATGTYFFYSCETLEEAYLTAESHHLAWFIDSLLDYSGFELEWFLDDTWELNPFVYDSHNDDVADYLRTTVPFDFIMEVLNAAD